MNNQPYVTGHNNPAQHTPPDMKVHEGALSVIGTILLIMIAPLIAVIFTMFVFQSYEVDGPSMQSTLQNQDRLIVYKLPRTVSRITRQPYLPKRGDIVVFERKDTESADFSHEDNKNKQLIKRVIGLPGDRVVVSDGQIRVYNKEYPDGYNPDAGTSYVGNAVPTPGNIDLTVPANEVFLAGDNRANSLDSRYFGTVPANDVIGKLVLRLWPDAQKF